MSKQAVVGTVTALCVVALVANAAQASAALTLEQRVLRPNEFSGFTPMGQHPVIISDGPFQYLVGTGFSSTAKKASSRAQLIAAATELYHRVHGR